MQEEALRRVREMQSGTFSQPSSDRSQGRNGGLHSREKQVENKNEEQGETSREKPHERAAAKDGQEEKPDALQGLFKDKEKLLILLLIMLLSQEGTNTELVLALLYIII